MPAMAREPGGVLAELVWLGHIDQNAVQLFQNLKDARNAALRTVQDNSDRSDPLRLRPEQALRFLDMSQSGADGHAAVFELDAVGVCATARELDEGSVVMLGSTARRDGDEFGAFAARGVGSHRSARQ